jgi:hypothetical protein
MRISVLYQKAGILIGFVPLIVYGILAGSTESSVVFALAVTAIVTVLVGLPDLRKGMILMWTTLLFFTGAFIAVGVLQVNGIIPWMGVLIYITLATVTFGSLLLGTPFTLQYAWEMVDRSVWEKPGFIRVNRLMTGVWGGVFVINLALSMVALAGPDLIGRVAPLLTYIVLAAGIVFTIWYPRRVQKNNPPVPTRPGD